MSVGKASDHVSEDDALAVFVERHLLVRDVDLDVRVLDVERFAVSRADDLGHNLARVQRPQPFDDLLRQRVAVHLVAHVQKLNRNVTVNLGFELIFRVGNVIERCPVVCQRAHACLIDHHCPVGIQGHKCLRLFLRDGLRGLLKRKLRRGFFEVDSQ